MTTLCIVAGTIPLLTGMLEPSGPVARGELRANDSRAADEYDTVRFDSALVT
jgi:hypothetical protein